MKIIKPYAKIDDYCHHSRTDIFYKGPFCILCGIELLQKIERYARVSHRTESSITSNSYDKFLRFIVMEKGDFSVTEHASVTVEAVVDRGITHEWVRHRLGAYTQESTRFVNYTKGGKEPEFIQPPNLDLDKEPWVGMMKDYEQNYKVLLQSNSPQIARSVLPNALASKLIVTYNLRMWRHFFLLRTSKESHPQMREVTIPLLKEFQEKIPILFEDIIPNEKQSSNMRMIR